MGERKTVHCICHLMFLTDLLSILFINKILAEQGCHLGRLKAMVISFICS